MANETDRIIKLRIAEYKATQDSAQHHDNLLWYVSSIVWGGNLVLLGSFLYHRRITQTFYLLCRYLLYNIESLSVGMRIYFQRHSKPEVRMV